MTKVAIASSTQRSADAGAAIARAGGNAIDTAIAASMVAITTEPGVCSLGCGGFITIWPPDGEPVTIDGNIEMPGRGLDPARLGGGAWKVTLDYGGGIDTYVGHGSVGTPGGLAAYDAAWKQFGTLPWSDLLQPSIALTRDGFPLSRASHNYLFHAHELVYGWSPQSHEPLHHADGTLKSPGDTLVLGDLSASLGEIARYGADCFYRGSLAEQIAADSEEHDGVMTARDLAEYQVQVRSPLRIDMNDWSMATNPAPAIGGASLAAMLVLLKKESHCYWDRELTQRIADIQHRVLMYRFRHLDKSNELDRDIQKMLETAQTQGLPLVQGAPSTVHTSVVDSDGLACAITMSSGYGSGVVPPDTGIWMNNCLGEIELNRKGLNAGPTGMRLASNMAPTTARHTDGRTLSIGSPGADRITSALLCTFNNYLRCGMTLDHAIAHPRLHVEINDGDPRVAYETGLDIRDIKLPLRQFSEPSMFFGGVGAALLHADGHLQAAADPRRAGGHAIV
ncbi:MAG: gamma-glutamyltransferase [Gammaproteobacteria bacterium]|nr:gamma-glutamyltransferase [Gammaproteobacteria bacterium]